MVISSHFSIIKHNYIRLIAVVIPIYKLNRIQCLHYSCRTEIFFQIEGNLKILPRMSEVGSSGSSFGGSVDINVVSEDISIFY